MSTRKIIDIEQNGEKVWPKGHAKATYMSDGRTVEDAINAGGGGGGIPDLEEVLAPRNVGVVDTTTEIDDTIPFATTDYVNSAIASAITLTINADY